MKKRRKSLQRYYHQFFIFFVVSFVIFGLIFVIYERGNIGITGFVVFNSQPGPEGKDVYIRENSDSNYDGQEVLKVGKIASGLDLRSLIFFNLSSVPSSDTIVSAKLQLYESYSSTGNPLTVDVYLLTSDWIESQASWNNASSSEVWSSPGGDYGVLIDSVVFSSAGYYNLTITHAVRSWMNGSYDNYGLLLVSEDAGVGDYKDIGSSDASTSSERPEIFVDHEGNAIPTILNLSTDSSLSNPKDVGEDVSFSISWEDIEGDNAKAFVCNSSDITLLGCADKTFCNTSLSSTNPITCDYSVLTSDNRTQQYFVSVCDGNCSLVSNSSFYTNHIPTISSISPSGGETINQSLGNYSIGFNATDVDDDSLEVKVYYSETQNSPENLITTIDVSTSCSGGVCNYSWDSTGLYGTYYFLFLVNDSFSVVNLSSSSVNVYSLIDNEPPLITAQGIDSYIYSGKRTSIYANISEVNPYLTWVSFDFPSQNVTLTNTSYTNYNATFIAPAVGNYSFKIYSIDRTGNLNNSLSWQEFSVSKPSAQPQNEIAPSIALPYHTILISSELNASDSLRDVYAYLYNPGDFNFVSGYSQNNFTGNFSNNETKKATWLVSVPFEEGSYSLNVGYTDFYGNSWMGDNFSIEVSSAVGGYELSINGYPEVETTQPYYVESFFSQNSVYINPDSVSISLYDSLGNLVSGPSSMTQKSTGIHNYSYTVGPSATEGQWETIVNATKSSVSYYGHEFWKVVGGPFDVRSINVVDSNFDSLEISVVTENTGGANKDLTLVWNLTRQDNGAQLDSGSETFMVEAESERSWTVYPSISYVGDVKIEFMGYYSQTEKAGAYKLFSTTSSGYVPPSEEDGPSGGGGGGASPEPVVSGSLSLEDFPSEIVLSRNIPKTIFVSVKNIGSEKLTGIELSLEDFDDSFYTISPFDSSLSSGKTLTFEITFLISDFLGEKESAYVISSDNGESLRQEFLLNVMNMDEFFSSEFIRLEKEIDSLKKKYPDSIGDLDICQAHVNALKKSINEEGFIDAKGNLDDAEDCLNSFKDKKAIPDKEEGGGFVPMGDYTFWIVTWVLIVVLIVVLMVALYLIYKKLSIINFVKQKEDVPSNPDSLSKDRMIDDKIRDIKGKLGR
jgi:uncharacterized membrane protein